VLESELSAQIGGKVFGLDIDRGSLRLAAEYAPTAGYTQGDAFHLPFTAGSFDLTFCHFLLLWTPDPGRVVEEMRRVTRRGGTVLSLAEPDYEGRIDYPDDLARLGALQREAIRRQGADPSIGRRLRGIFNSCGLQGVEVGVLGGQWSGNPDAGLMHSEWAVLRTDLEGVLPVDELQAYQQQDTQAWEEGSRVLYVPTFYAWGSVP
jgi:SAM-dependent methyltransferase